MSASAAPVNALDVHRCEFPGCSLYSNIFLIYYVENLLIIFSRASMFILIDVSHSNYIRCSNFNVNSKSEDNL